MKRLAHASSQWAQSVFPEITSVRVLIVADGNLNFLHEVDGLGLSHLRDVLQSNAFPWETVTVTTAHRSNPNVGADIAPFSFANRDRNGEYLFTIKNFEQVWLFGYEREGSANTLSQTELKIVSDFMEAGGGVFATGDHQDLGFALCGALPRVRSMRKWSFNNLSPSKAPDRNGPTRIDTLRTGKTPGFQRKDEEDNTPQEIFPKYFVDCTATISYPHPLLANGDFPITVLPDHMHEGMCIIPESLENTFAFDGDEPKPEYPFITGTPAKVSPVPVAAAVSASGYTVNEGNIFPVQPSCFTVITAYDGHYIKRVTNNQEIRLGRVVVDASFHHFVNMNLDGFCEEALPSPHLEDIKRYFLNIRSWLSPAKVQSDSCLKLLLTVRYSKLLEELQPGSDFNLDEIFRVGRITQQAIAEFFSPSEARTCTLSLAAKLPLELSNILTEAIDPWLQGRPRNLGVEALLDSQAVSSAIIGSAMLGISAGLPENPYEERPPGDPRQQMHNLRERASQALNLGLAKVFQALSKSTHTVGVLSKSLTTTSSETFPRSVESGSKEINLMLKCAANADNPWESFVNSIEEGDITIQPEQADGSFLGRHHGMQAELAGNCFEASGNEPHRIIFRVPRTNPRHLYVGVINEGGDRITGRRYTFGMFSTSEEPAEGFTRDEVWTGIKTT